MQGSTDPDHKNPAARPVRARFAPLAFVLALLAGSLLLHAGSREVVFDLVFEGAHRELESALFQGAPVRTSAGGEDRVYLMSTQAESVLAFSRRPIRLVRTDYLHVDLWSIDADRATVAWRKRLRSFEGPARAGRVLPAFVPLGVDGGTLWINVDGPLGVSLPEGRVVADGARIDEANPRFTGARVDKPGYVAFGRNGLQLTLDDASQWRIDAHDLGAAPRDTPVRDPAGIAAPAPLGATNAFQARALPLADRWLGVLTDEEADHLRRPPVIPGRDPGERPGVMQRFLEEQHVPPPLHDPLPQRYRLWSARVEQVSAAPPEWPKEWPDTWGMRPRFSGYQVLPESPVFLRAGLLRPHRESEVPFWYRDPDSVLVLHVDKLGDAGRLQLTRIAGPRGATAWTVALPFTTLDSVMHHDADLVLWGRQPMPGRGDEGDTHHHKLARIDVASGSHLVLDLTTESMHEDGMAPTAMQALPHE